MSGARWAVEAAEAEQRLRAAAERYCFDPDVAVDRARMLSTHTGLRHGEAVNRVLYELVDEWARGAR